MFFAQAQVGTLASLRLRFSLFDHNLLTQIMTDSEAAETSNNTHPLQFKWTLWHDVAASRGKTSASNYAANMREVASFDTVEDFWA